VKLVIEKKDLDSSKDDNDVCADAGVVSGDVGGGADASGVLGGVWVVVVMLVILWGWYKWWWWWC